MLLTRCPKCRAPLHVECWKENGESCPSCRHTGSPVPGLLKRMVMKARPMTSSGSQEAGNFRGTVNQLDATANQVPGQAEEAPQEHGPGTRTQQQDEEAEASVDLDEDEDEDAEASVDLDEDEDEDAEASVDLDEDEDEDAEASVDERDVVVSFRVTKAEAKQLDAYAAKLQEKQPGSWTRNTAAMNLALKALRRLR
jgi:hypothetical protein